MLCCASILTVLVWNPDHDVWHYMASTALTSRQQINMVFTDSTDKTRVHRIYRIKFYYKSRQMHLDL